MKRAAAGRSPAATARRAGTSGAAPAPRHCLFGLGIGLEGRISLFLSATVRD